MGLRHHQRRRVVLLLTIVIVALVVYYNFLDTTHLDIHRQLPSAVHTADNLQLYQQRLLGKQPGAKKDASSHILSRNDSMEAPPLMSAPAEITRGRDELTRGNITQSTPRLHGLGPHIHNEALLNTHLLTCDQLNSSTFQTDIFCLRDEADVVKTLFKPSRYGLCYTDGAENISVHRQCFCKPGWHGQYCSTPDIVKSSDYPSQYDVKIREIPARVVYGIPFLHEFELLETRLHEIGHLVDVFIILESNFTAYGQAKPKLLLERLKQGYLQEYHRKIFHISVDYFPEEAHKNGWIADELSRHAIGFRGVSYIKNLRMDDVFVVTDSDELPAWETIFFLKFHIGYPQPVGIHLRHNVYGFFWQDRDETTHVYAACSIDMLIQLFDNNPYHLRGALHYMDNKAHTTNNDKYRLGGRVRKWSFGTSAQPAGWHCSWCLTPSGIRVKLLAAQASDGTRWGSYVSKTKIPYIEKLIRDGVWFDDKTKHLPVLDTRDRMYAPAYLMTHNQLAPHILFPPYNNKTT